MNRSRRSYLTPVVVAMLAVAGCGRPHRSPAVPAVPPGSEADGVAPPQATGVRLFGTQVEVSGRAVPGGAIRLATPGGQTISSSVNQNGVWRVLIPAPSSTMIFGLSELIAGRTIQSQGYIFVTGQGKAVVLRAGAGAITLSPPAGSTVAAFDVDRQGGALVSGLGPPGGVVGAWIDGRKLAEGRVDPSGRFALSLSGPVSRGGHTLKVFGDSINETLRVDATPAAALVDGPFRAISSGSGLRVDWMTPGGGVQTTLVLP